MEELQRRIAATKFCKGMESRHVSLLAERAGERDFSSGAFIFREGEEAHQFYIIHAGKVSLEVSTPERGAIVVQTIGAGDALGLSWLFPPFHWHFDARAVEATSMFAFDAAWLREKIGEDRDFGYEVLKRVAQVMVGRLQATRLQMTDMYGGVG
jgi:CRP-like cAMP-binding protein